MYFQLVESVKAKSFQTQDQPDVFNLHRRPYRVALKRALPVASLGPNVVRRLPHALGVVAAQVGHFKAKT